VAADLLRSKRELIAENAFLRQQVIVLKRQHTGRLPITPQDRRVLVVLASKLRGWKDALHIVQPETLVTWHRQGFRLLWRRKSQGQPRQPRLSPETIALIKEMAVEEPLVGLTSNSRRVAQVGDQGQQTYGAEVHAPGATRSVA
jgi:putative transposase